MEDQTTNPPVTQPKKVTTAIRLLIASLVLGLIIAFVAKFTGAVKTDTDPNFLAMSIFIIVYMVMVLFIYLLNKGEKLARTIFAILFAIGMVIYLFVFIAGLAAVFSHFSGDELRGFIQTTLVTFILSIIQTIIEIVAVILLFSKESNEWFNLKAKFQNEENQLF